MEGRIVPTTVCENYMASVEQLLTVTKSRVETTSIN